MIQKTTVLFTPSDALLQGVNIMADAVGSTLGPCGRNVAIAKTNHMGEIYERVVLHDGVSVARAIDLPNENENMGAQLLKQAAQKQVDEVGDGTTVTMVLAQAIITECLAIMATGVNPMTLRAGLEAGVDKLLKALDKKAIPINTKQQTTNIATISAENAELGALVADTIGKSGKDGIIAVEESKNTTTTMEHHGGMRFDHGYVHPLFVTNPERMEALLEDPLILVTDKTLTSLTEIEGLLNSVVTHGKKLVLFAPDFGTDALALLLQNKLDGKLLTLCIKSPSWSQDKESLQDLAIHTGATMITEDAGHKFEDVTIDWLGKAEQVSALRESTTVVGGKGKATEQKKRVASIDAALRIVESAYEKEKLRERKARLTNGVYVIKVGGTTEVEMNERRERVIDAVHATQAALDSGIVPGGEVTYLNLRSVLRPSTVTEGILYRALAKPFLKLCTNAGLDAGQMLERIETATLSSVGIDVTTGELQDMIAAGIIDPAAVPREALRNALSVAVQIVTTGCTITPIKEKKE
jgi:chaperonin GroEL